MKIDLKKHFSLASMCVAIALVAVLSDHATAQMRITEWMYNTTGDGEFIELTNVGDSPIDMTGWSFSDSAATPGSFDLSGFGTVDAGEIVIITEALEADFRTAWNLAAEVKIVGELSPNLGRNDEINIYDSADAIVDQLTYGDQDFPGTIRTQNFSGNPRTTAALGANDPGQWDLAFVGDIYGSYASVGGDVGNPGLFAIPEPAALALLVIGAFIPAQRFRRG